MAERISRGANILRAPVDNLTSNWAYMVMASLVWSLKTRFALLVPVVGRWRERHESQKSALLRMQFRTFLNAVINIPCQTLTTGRQLVYRVLAWNTSALTIRPPELAQSDAALGDELLQVGVGLAGGRVDDLADVVAKLPVAESVE